MKMRNKIIGGSYLYIGGIVLAILFPLDPGWLLYTRILAGLGLVLAGGLMLIQLSRLENTAGVWSRGYALVWPALALGALALGYTRYISANTVPDMQIGEIRVEAGQARFEQRPPLADTSRLRIQKTTDIDRDIQLRFRGELDARVAVRGQDGRYQLDEKGRWVFEIHRAPIQSAVITIAAEDPVGTEYVLGQPFNRITGLDWLSGPSEAALRVYRISNHIGSFVRPARAQSPVTVLGRITSDPRVYDFKTVLMVSPTFIQYPAGGPFYRVEGGDIQVTIDPTLLDYPQFARTSAYGADVQIEGELTVARAASNPGGFDARQFMQNYNIYGLMRPYQPRDQPAPMRMVAPEGQSVRSGHGLVAFSLELRDRVLLIFKSTMPYPQSAFLGGVTLGLRYGLQGAQFPGENEAGPMASRLGFERSESTIVDDFRASGVNHVLAVSGLHVTILTVMFTAIFALLKFPKQVFVPFVIFALVVFAIITGARPSTLRAVIMNSLFLLTWAYLNQGLLSSVLIGVPVAAFLILIHNPLVVVDPSFTLSFGAILSLALITMPVHEHLCLLRGNRLAVVILWVLATTVIGIQQWALVTTGSFIVLWLLMGWGAFLLAGALERRGLGLSQRFAFAALPEGVSTFIAAQVAIQIGMMIPLSGYYFMRWPFAGAFANLIAIPLIGVVVQLGAIGGLLGLIPVIGPYIALLLSAANWIFATFFLWLAHVSTLLFPYPVVRRPRVVELIVYYAFLAALVWHKPLGKWIRQVCDKRGVTWKYAPMAMAAGLAVLASSPLWIAPPRDSRPAGMHVSILSVGYGSAILVESPGGRRYLIDSGFVEHERGRRNEADRTILPFLSHHAIRHLHGLILTSPLPERAAGASTLLQHLRIDALFVPPILSGLYPGMTYDEFVAGLGPSSVLERQYESERLRSMFHEWVGHPEWPRRPAIMPALTQRGDTLLHRWSGWRTETMTAAAGMILAEEVVEGIPFRIEVLGPVSPSTHTRRIENQGVSLRIVHGDVAILIPGTLHYDGQRELAEAWSREQLRSAIIVMPHHGAANPTRDDRPDREVVLRALQQNTAVLLDQVQPEVAIMEWGSPRPVLGMGGRTAVNLYETTRQFVIDRLGEGQVLSTDRDLAIVIHSDGQQYALTTQAQRNRAAGGEEDAVSDLSVGL